MSGHRGHVRKQQDHGREQVRFRKDAAAQFKSGRDLKDMKIGGVLHATLRGKAVGRDGRALRGLGARPLPQLR